MRENTVIKCFLLALMPFVGQAQAIHLIDTVDIDGYFYDVGRSWETRYRPSEGPMAKELYFVSIKQLTVSPLAKLIASSLRERDTVKFAAGPAPAVFTPYEGADAKTRAAIAGAIRVFPIDSGQVGSPSGFEDYSIFASYVRMRWLHFKVHAPSVQGLNRPSTYDYSVASQLRFFDYYLPLEVLEVKKGAIVQYGELGFAKATSEPHPAATKPLQTERGGAIMRIPKSQIDINDERHFD